MADSGNVQHIAELGFDLSGIQKQFEQLDQMVVQQGIRLNELAKNNWNLEATLNVRSTAGTDAQKVMATETLKANEALKAQSAAIVDVEKKQDGLIAKSAKFSLAYQGIHAAQKALKETVQTMTDVESKMVDIARVMELNDTQTKALRDSIFSVAQAYGSTFEDASEVTLRFAQAGYDAADAAKATEAALLAMNTAELNVNSATSGLISILKQWGMEASDLTGIIDKLNYTADNNAVTTQNLVDGLAVSSSMAKAAGISFDDLTAILTVMGETSGRTGKEVGNAFKSILAYIQRPASLDWFDAHGIEVYADTAKDALLPMMDILGNMSEAWTRMTTVQQDSMASQAESAGLLTENMAQAAGAMDDYTAYVEATAEATDMLNTAESRALAQQAAGVYRRSLYISLLENFADVSRVSAEMQDAEGHSMAENARRMETLQVKVNQLVTALQQLAVQLGEAGFMDLAKGLVDLATGVATLTKNTGGLTPVILLAAKALLTLKLNAALAKNEAMMTGVDKAMVALNTAVTGAGGGFAGLAAGAKTAGAAINTALGPIGWTIIAIQGLIGVYNLLNQAVEKSISQSKELRDSFVSDQKAANNHLESLEKLREEYDELSKSIGKNGEQGGLTADQYGRYKDVVAQILEMHPSLIDGYNSEGEAISNRNDLLEEAIRLQKEEIELRKQTYISEEQPDVIQGYRDQIALYQKDINEALRGTTRFSKDVLDIFSGTSFAGPETVSTITSVLDKFDLSIGKLESGATEYQELLVERRAEIVKSLSEELEYNDEQLAAVNQLIDKVEIGLRGIRVEASKISTELVDFAAFSPETQDWYTAFAGEYKAYLDELKDKINEVATDVSGWENQKNSVDEFGRSVKDALDDMPLDRVQELKDQLSSGTITADEFRAAVERYRAELEAADDGTDAYSNAVGVVVGDLEDFADAQEKAAASTDINASALGQWASSIDTSKKVIDDLMSSISSLESSMTSLAEGKGLSLDATLDLIDKYPELASAIHFVGDEWYFEADALEAVRQAKYSQLIASEALNVVEALSASITAEERDHLLELAQALYAATDATARQAAMAEFMSAAHASAAGNTEALSAALAKMSLIQAAANQTIVSSGTAYRGNAAAIKAQTDAINDQIKALQEQQKASEKANQAEIKRLQDIQKEAEKASKAIIDALKAQHEAALKYYDEQEKAVKSRYDAEIKALRDLKTESSREDARADYLKSREDLLKELAEQEKRTSPEAARRIKEIKEALAKLDEEESRRLRDIDIDDQISDLEKKRDAEIEAIKAAAEAEKERYNAQLAALQAQQEATKESYQTQIDALKSTNDAQKEATEAKIEALRKELEEAKKVSAGQVENVNIVGEATAKMYKDSDVEMRNWMEHAKSYFEDWANSAKGNVNSVYERIMSIQSLLLTLAGSPLGLGSMFGMVGSGLSIPSSHAGSIVSSDGLVNVQAGEIIVRKDISDNLIRAANMMNQTYNTSSTSNYANRSYSNKFDFRGANFGGGTRSRDVEVDVIDLINKRINRLP